MRPSVRLCQVQPGAVLVDSPDPTPKLIDDPSGSRSASNAADTYQLLNVEVKLRASS